MTSTLANRDRRVTFAKIQLNKLNHQLNNVMIKELYFKSFS